MDPLEIAVAQLEILVREARASGDFRSHDILIAAQNTILHSVLMSAKYDAQQIPTSHSQRPQLKIVR